MIHKNKPTKNPNYLTWVRSQPCVICGQWSNAHHIIGHGRGRMGGKSSDLTAFPLCHTCHSDLHDHGYKTWEQKHGHDQWYYVQGTIMRALMDGVI